MFVETINAAEAGAVLAGAFVAVTAPAASRLVNSFSDEECTSTVTTQSAFAGTTPPESISKVAFVAVTVPPHVVEAFVGLVFSKPDG
jgi:hypothetical protein